MGAVQLAQESSDPRLVYLAGALISTLLAVAGWLRFRRRDVPRPRAVVATKKAPDRAHASLDDLLDASRRMAEAADATQIRRTAVADAVRLTQAQAGAYLRRTHNGHRFVATSHKGFFADGEVGRGPVLRVLETGRAMCAVTEDDPTIARLPVAVAAVPVIVSGAVSGAIVVIRPASDPFDALDLEALNLLAPIAGSALLAAESEHTASPENGGAPENHGDRRRLVRDLRALDHDTMVGLALIEVDRPDDWSDDPPLTQTIADNVRSDDVVYRTAGGAYSVLMQQTTRADARRVLERVRAAVAATGRSTVTAGFVLGRSDQAQLLTARAEEALAAARASGPNRVFIAD